MTRRMVLLPLLAAIVPALALALELANPGTDARPVAAARLTSVAAPPPPPPAPVAAWTSRILARPVLRPDRRPLAPAVGAGSGMAALPRLSGVLTSSADRFAIFAAADGRLIVAREGARLGPYTVLAIGDGQVTVLGPNGRQVLRPHFAPGQPAPPATPRPGPRPPPPPPPAPPASAGGSILDLLHAGHPAPVALPPPPALESLLQRPPP